jgi:hypothetical protein
MTTSETSDLAEGTAGYGLPEVFEALRHDLTVAQQKLLNDKREPVMKLGGTEIELTFTLVKDKKGEGRS